MQAETLRAENLNLHYRVIGAGPNVLFVHGWASSGRMWQSAMNHLAPRFRCWALDLAGFGDSDKPTNGWYAVPNFSASVRAFAQAAGIERASLVGHSMGGLIALHMAATQPDFVKRLVVVNPVVTGHVRLQLRVLLDHGVDRQLVALTQRLWMKATPASALGGLRALATYDTAPLLANIAAPTLVVASAHDLVVSPRESRLAAARIPNARLIEMPSGHSPTDDRAGEFNSLLSAFLATPD